MKKNNVWKITRNGSEYWWGASYIVSEVQKQTFKRLKDAKAWLERTIIKSERDRLELISEEPSKVCYKMYFKACSDSTRWTPSDTWVIWNTSLEG